MAYPKLYNRLSFFEPIMAVAANDTKPLANIDIGAANATHGEFVCVKPCVVRQLRVAVTKEAVVGTSTAPYVAFKKYTAANAGGDLTAVGTVTVPDASAIGKVIYKDGLSVRFAEGDVMQLSHVIGTGGSVSGQVTATWFCEDSPEVVENNTDLAESST